MSRLAQRLAGGGGLALAALAAPAAPAAAVCDWFTDQAVAAGLDFAHHNGMTGELHYNEMMGGGVALLDYDGDGDLDVYLVQSGPIGEPPPGDPRRPHDRLFRNDVPLAGGGGLRFVDVTERAGIGAGAYGMGAATADYDGDGWTDLYVTAWGPNRLLRNRGDGTFEDVTAASGAGERRWSVAATFLDYDGDGRQDLFIGNYVRYDLAARQVCHDLAGAPDYCGPLAFRPEPDRLLRNRGDGTFEDVSTRAGLGAAFGAALGAVAGDFDGDGWQDLYVANDMTENQLWRNRGDGTLRDEALFAGCAVNADGVPEASMGIAAGDYDGDGDEDLFVTHLDNETHTLFQNDGRGLFRDRTAEAGLAAPSWRFTGFGTAWLDLDRDGRLDLVAVHGAVKRIAAQVQAGDPLPLRQTDLLFRNEGGGRFSAINGDGGATFARAAVSRGLAAGDLDNDGHPDLVVVDNGGPVRLLVHQGGATGSWVGVRVLAGAARQEALGARVRVSSAGRAGGLHTVRTGGSYAAAADPRLLVGLAAAPRVDRIDVRWSDGRRGRWLDLPARTLHTLVPAPETTP